MPFRGRVRNPLPRIDGRKADVTRRQNVPAICIARIRSALAQRFVSGDGLEQSRHTFKQGSQGRCGLGRGLDHDVAARSAADLELREELAHFARGGKCSHGAKPACPRARIGGGGRTRRRRGAACGEVSVGAAAALVLRLVGCLDQLVERIGGLVVDAGVARVGVFIGDVAGGGDGVESPPDRRVSEPSPGSSRTARTEPSRSRRRTGL